MLINYQLIFKKALKLLNQKIFIINKVFILNLKHILESLYKNNKNPFNYINNNKDLRAW